MTAHGRIEAAGIAPAFNPELRAYADSLRPDHPHYWPALAASDGCDASLADLNDMLAADDCRPFAAESYIPAKPMGD